MRGKVCVIVGTRPEAIKLVSVIQSLSASAEFEPFVVATGQHKEMVLQVFDRFGITVDKWLDMPPFTAQRESTPELKLSALSAGVLEAMTDLLRAVRPRIVVVQGDTTSAGFGAIAAFYQRIPVAHVEAGLRTFDMDNPFPEEFNRKLIACVARWHFAPSSTARQNLLNEGIPEDSIYSTGNTVVDALRLTLERVGECAEGGSSSAKPRVVITAHRRENWGEPLRRICMAIRTLCTQHADMHFVFYVHPNPAVRAIVHEELAGSPCALEDPLPYDRFVVSLSKASLVITDSGGIQEETAVLNIPTLITRDETERPEGLQNKIHELVGTDVSVIVSRANEQLVRRKSGAACGVSEYGDGRAGEAIVRILAGSH